MSGATVLVLGAAGFIGRHVCRRLAASGHRVIGMGHGSWSQDEWAQWGLRRWSAADINPDTLHAAMGNDRPTAIVHCAGTGAVSQSYTAPYDDYNRTVASTAAILEFVRTSYNSGTRVVLTSSAAVYGDQGDVDLQEAATRSPISPYGFNKVAAENLGDAYSRFFNGQISIVRLFSVYGAGLRKQLLWDAMNKFSSGETSFLGTGHELRDWIHVNDAAALLEAAAITPQASFEIYNGGHVKRTTREVLKELATQAGFAVEPRFTGDTHVGNPRRLTANWTHAQRQLPWAPRTQLSTGLKDYVDWYRRDR